MGTRHPGRPGNIAPHPCTPTNGAGARGRGQRQGGRAAPTPRRSSGLRCQMLTWMAVSAAAPGWASNGRPAATLSPAIAAHGRPSPTGTGNRGEKSPEGKRHKHHRISDWSGPLGLQGRLIDPDVIVIRPHRHRNAIEGAIPRTVGGSVGQQDIAPPVEEGDLGTRVLIKATQVPGVVDAVGVGGESGGCPVQEGRPRTRCRSRHLPVWWP